MATARHPQLGLRGQKVVLGLHGRRPGQGSGQPATPGRRSATPSMVVGTGLAPEPSEAYSRRRQRRARSSSRPWPAPGWHLDPAAHLDPDDPASPGLRRSFGHVGARVGALRKTTAEWLRARRGLAEQRDGTDFTRPLRALSPAAPQLERGDPRDASPWAGPTVDGSQAGSVTAPSLAELTSAAYLASTPVR